MKAEASVECSLGGRRLRAEETETLNSQGEIGEERIKQLQAQALH